MIKDFILKYEITLENEMNLDEETTLSKEALEEIATNAIRLELSEIGIMARNIKELKTTIIPLNKEEKDNE